MVETVEKVEEKEEEVKDTRTSAEKAYAAVQAKRVSCFEYLHGSATPVIMFFTQQKEKILQKAKKTHKQRVEVRNACTMVHVSLWNCAGNESISGHTH